MHRDTPALDQLTAYTKAEFCRRIVEMDADFIPPDMTTRQMLLGKAVGTPETTIYLQLDPLASVVIPPVYQARRAPGQTSKENRARGITVAVEAGAPGQIAPNLSALVRDADDYLTGMTAQILNSLDDVSISPVLVELWHAGYEEFDANIYGNELDYNSDDRTPNDCETPHNHLMDLISDAVIARLMKRSGPEILLAWSDAVKLARR